MTKRSLIILSLLLPFNAFACHGQVLETYTFFKNLPPTASVRAVIAKIKVLSVAVTKDYERITTAKVVTAIKGTKAGAGMKIGSDMSSCSRDPDIQAGQEYFVAGSISPDGIFRGQFKFLELTPTQ